MIECSIDNVNVKEIIAAENVFPMFQPIVSIKQKMTIGMEALCRGFFPDRNNVIQPYRLFGMAEEQDVLLELDRLCRRKALEEFQHLYQQNPHFLLFLNLSISLIDKGFVGSNHLQKMVQSFHINTSNIVIEILESNVKNIDDLKKFVRIYKDFGFLIAIDDIGSGSSNLSRIHLLEPDILKIDMSIIRNIDKEFYKQEVFKSIVNLAKKIGALVVAEGIETESEASTAFELGADMLQGYYFIKPQENIDHHKLDKLADFVCCSSAQFKNNVLDKYKNLQNRYKMCHDIIEHIIHELQSSDIQNLDETLEQFIGIYPPIECIYVLNHSGMQVSHTVHDKTRLLKQKRIIFKPAPKSTDHSLKDYFLYIKAGMEKYVSEQYISLATGNLCITVAKSFTAQDGIDYILCVDLSPQNYRCANE